MMKTAPVAPRHMAARRGRTVRAMGLRVTYKAVAEQTGGAYSLFEAVAERGAGGSPQYSRFEDATSGSCRGSSSSGSATRR